MLSACSDAFRMRLDSPRSLCKSRCFSCLRRTRHKPRAPRATRTGKASTGPRIDLLIILWRQCSHPTLTCVPFRLLHTALLSCLFLATPMFNYSNIVFVQFSDRHKSYLLRKKSLVMILQAATGHCQLLVSPLNYIFSPLLVSLLHELKIIDKNQAAIGHHQLARQTQTDVFTMGILKVYAAPLS